MTVYHQSSIFNGLHMGCRSLCSQVDDDEQSSDEVDDLENGFSDPRIQAASILVGRSYDVPNGEELASEPELMEDNLAETCRNDLDASEIDMGTSGEDSQKKRGFTELFEIIVGAPRRSMGSALNKWVEEGNNLDRPLAASILSNLRKRRMYGKALEYSEWLEGRNVYDFTEQDYASQLNLIARIHGLWKAEKYVETIPESLKGVVVHHSLLAIYVADLNLEKAEALFKTMRDLVQPITVAACNQMIVLYKRRNKRKIADILLLMENENVKPSLLTYKLLIDSKGNANDIIGMEQLVNNMKAEGLQPDLGVRAVLARHYVSQGLNDKAEAVLEEIEGSDLKTSRTGRKTLLSLHASLGNAEGVGRIWRECELNPKVDECMVAIEAWGKLGKIEEAEAVFEKMLHSWQKLSSRQYSTLLKVYANHKLVNKGKEHVRRMVERGCWIGPLAWDALVKLFIESGELEKADSILQKAAEMKGMKPRFNSYMMIMGQYARRGDVHNTEKLFHRMRQKGYTGRLKPFEVLIQAYINSETPAYGFWERMKAENIYPTKSFAEQLALADAFGKKATKDLLD
ncbi:pentatricopeptide repeat-containing protein At1g80270, mitochondrial-like [Malania oleifera]|uniref:pentatricopeptide repeat-containing protein At1g80270, mitochondrial-like n=1 Tax=Malania oleifera TaxID=397392 RepID=UPI0025AEC0BE|nr:pentatricopeptide repeat-containing protein At1g80270, mitochondrial-like [Malania oleifera]